MTEQSLKPPAAGWRRTLQRELGPLLTLLVLGISALGFLALADEVGEGGTRALDLRILKALHSGADLTALGSITDLTLIVLLIAGLFAGQRRWGAALGLIASGVGGIALSQGLKLIFGRERPPLQFHAVEVVNASFPSGHAMLSAIVYLTLGASAARLARTRRMKIYAISCAVAATLLVGCSRVYLGVHWFTDVLAGWCVGAAWAMFCWLVALAWLRFGPQRAREAGQQTGA